MSSRAIRALRDDILPSIDSDDEENDDDDDDEVAVRGSTFANLLGDDDDDSSSEDSEQEEETPAAVREEKPASSLVVEEGTSKQHVEEGEEEEEEEDLDALLEEFASTDVETREASTSHTEQGNRCHFLLDDLDWSSLDVEYSMRQTFASSGGSRVRRRWIFGGPPTVDAPKPPNFLGGGIGMDDTAEDGSFSFRYSTEYMQLLGDYETIQRTGDVQSLVFFVIHHPFVVEALLQLASVCYQADRSFEGLSLLRRVLWIYECAMLPTFARQGGRLDSSTANQTFVKALQLQVKVAIAARLSQTVCATLRYALAWNSSQDPVGVLFVMDAWAIPRDENDAFVIAMIENLSGWNKSCMEESYELSTAIDWYPGWSYSYAMALFRSTDDRQQADEALRRAILRFPNLLLDLLSKNDVDLTGRSTRRDWPTVVPSLQDRSTQLRRLVDVNRNGRVWSDMVERVSAYYVEHAHLPWSRDDVLQWIYDNAKACLDEPVELGVPEDSVLDHTVARFEPCDLTLYNGTFERLPVEANILDAGLLAQALVIDPWRGRLLRRAQQQGGGGDVAHDLLHGHQQAAMLGPPTGRIDPDSPIAEVLWRSFLPWNQVDGV